MRRTRVSHKTLAMLLCVSVLQFCCVATFAQELAATTPGGTERTSSFSQTSITSFGGPHSRLQYPLKARFAWQNGRLVTTNPALVTHKTGATIPDIAFAPEPAAEAEARFPVTLTAPAAMLPLPADTPTTTGGQKIMAWLILGGVAAASAALAIHASNQKDPVLGARTPTRVIP